MKKVILFGAGRWCHRWLQHSSDNYYVLAIADNDLAKSSTSLCGHRIIKPDRINEYDYDIIIITLDDINENGLEYITIIYNQLLGMGIKEEKIELQYLEYLPYEPRVVFLRNLSDEFSRYNIEGAIAECGVWRGAFAAYINNYFPNRKLYLFDTFEGFTERDMSAEQSIEAQQWLQTNDRDLLATGSELAVWLRCTYRENVIIRKGIVPETLSGLENERFAFVNLDMDLYQPQLAALRFFAPRMTQGGVILLHDYFWKCTPGVRQAVDEFAMECRFTRLPLGDNKENSSIALILN